MISDLFKLLFTPRNATECHITATKPVITPLEFRLTNSWSPFEYYDRQVCDACDNLTSCFIVVHDDWPIRGTRDELVINLRLVWLLGNLVALENPAIANQSCVQISCTWQVNKLIVCHQYVLMIGQFAWPVSSLWYVICLVWVYHSSCRTGGDWIHCLSC